MKTPLFVGSGTALVTPFSSGTVDYGALARLIDFQCEGDTAAIIVCGTTGEGATLSVAEHEQLFESCIRCCRGRMKVICGIGSNDTAAALELAQSAEDIGADGILMVTPYYNKTTQAGLIKHFTYVADRVRTPMIVYNVPSRTGIGITPETYAELAQHPGINGVKEASGDIAAFARTRALCAGQLNFWSGNDADTVPMMAMGAVGVISVASNIVPEVVSQLCSLCLFGDFTAAAELNDRYIDLFSKLFLEVNPIPVKTAMNIMGLCSDEMRLPLCSMSPQHARELHKCMDLLDL